MKWQIIGPIVAFVLLIYAAWRQTGPRTVTIKPRRTHNMERDTELQRMRREGL